MKHRLFMIVRMVACLLVAAMLSVCPVVGEEASSPTFEIGNTVFFGHYEQDNHIDNGVEPIEWMILDKQGDDILLLSKYVIDCKSYNDEKGETNWQSCSIRAWLNGEFLSGAFTEDEANCIIKTTIPNGTDEAPQKEKWNPATCGDTDDSVFLLSYQEYWKYLRNQSSTKGTEYANKQGAKGTIWNGNLWNSEAKQLTRSSGSNAKEVTCLYKNLDPSSESATKEQGIRPAMWINMSKFGWDNSTFYLAQEADNLANDGRYSEAIAIIESLSDYDDGLKKGVDYRTMAGESGLSNGEFSEAVKWFEDAKRFINENYEPKEAEKLIREKAINPALLESRYQLAKEYIDNADYEKAMELLTVIGQYQDSMNLLMDCYRQCHIQFGPVVYDKEDAVDTGYNTGFSGNSPIKRGNPHFELDLGYFMMSGYTEKREGPDGLEYIITPGDNMVLWFVLTEDIDELKGDKKLYIASVKDGADEELQTDEKEFGKGILLERHIDADGWDKGVTPYKDYLAAHEDTGANTKIEINEVGKYEIALDYRIGERKKIALNKYKFHDYSLRFSFTVKNGNGMYFLYDLNSGSEIQDYSRVEKGYKIDLKSSRALSIYAERYELNQKQNGLDTRSPELASDGDRFEKTGYYEITGTNTATKEKTTKHIFVGSEEDLALYKATGDERLANFE